MFVAQLDGGGTPLWSAGFGPSTTSITCNRAATDGAGNVLVTGDYQGALDFGGGPLPDPDGGVGRTSYLAKLTSAGAYAFSVNAGASGNSTGNGIAADAAGNVIAVGTFDTSIAFGGSALMSAGDDDVFAVKLGPTGAVLWQRRFGDASAQEGLGLAVGADGVPLATGAYLGALDFGSGPLPAAANGGAFVARLLP
jgi:hypothetical protein